MARHASLRNLILVLGDQLDERSSALDGYDAACDQILMLEVAGESTHVWSHKTRIALFLAAMRHFRDSLRKRGFFVHYRELDDNENQGTLANELTAWLEQLRPARLVVVEPGEFRVLEAVQHSCQRVGVPLQVRTDRHFYCTPQEFREHASGRKQLRMEYFYREMRRKHQVLMAGDQPEGGQWNFDAENRGAFGKQGPAGIPEPIKFKPDSVTRSVLKQVGERFADHPGSLDHFDWPVTARQARSALQDFVEHRLPKFGTYQDAMWTDEPYLYHSRLSAALNLKLLSPRQVVEAAVDAYQQGHAPLNAVEGFVRQILGWREYVRGVYGLYMPEYLERNELQATLPLPDFYWTGDTDMHCLSQAIGQTLQYGYAHHIQRLMVTGLFTLLLGVDPSQVHQWYLAVYVDAIEWVELPNTLGMSQYADGGVMASKPYVATGKYIQRMSNYCGSCRFNPAEATGERACPFTTLYWDFLSRHRDRLIKNPRMSLQVKNLQRKSSEELAAIEGCADQLRERYGKPRGG